MKDLSLTTKSADETRELGAKIGKHSEAGMVILLDGDLGAGKTCLTQGIAKGLDISRSVTSPTFTIQKIYHGRLLLNHIDAYRLEGIHQDLGFDEYLNDEKKVSKEDKIIIELETLLIGKMIEIREKG